MSTIRIMIKKVIAYLLIFSFFAGMVSDFSLMEVLAATDATVTNVELWINGVEYQETDHSTVYDNATFMLKIKWKVSNGVAAGDMIVIPLPDCIAVENRDDNVLSAFGNPDAGRYDIRDGYLYIRPSIPIDSNMEGYNEIEGVLASAYRPEQNVETKELQIYNKQYTMDIQKTSGTNTLSVSKGHGTMDEQGNVKYTVTVTSTGTNKNIVLADVFNDSAYMELTGEVTVQSSTGNTVTGTCSSSGSGFTYTLQPDYTMANGEKLTFEYTVKVKDSAFVDKDGQQLLNTAKVTSNNLSEGTTYVDRLDIRKSYVSKNVQANADGTYTWTIDVNSGVKVDIGGFVLQDILPSGFIPTTDAVITDSSGATVATISKNDFNNGFEYTFPSPSADSYQITYTTKVDKNYLVDYNPIDGTTYSNRAIIKKDDVTKGQYDRGVHIPGVGSILSKSAQSFKANGDKGIIHWVSTINIPDPSVYDMSGFQYADNVNMSNWNDIHQTFVDGTVVVKLNGTEIAQGTGEDQWEFGYKNLNRPYGQDDQFMIQFKNLLVGKTGTLTIEYDTTFNLKEYEATISNEASIYDGNKNLQLDKKTGNYSYSPVVKKYFDGYDSENLVFKWKVKVAIKDTETIRISDILPENQVFRAGTMKLTNSQYYDGFPLAISDSMITTGNDGEHNTLTLSLPKTTLESKEESSNSGYTWLWYETEIEDRKEFILGGEKTYTNVIEIKDQDGNSLGGSSVTTGSITPPESTILYKYMEIPYDGYHGQYLYYAIDVNTAGLTLLEGTGQLTLTDRLGKAISYRSGSFVIYTDSARTNKMDSSLYSMTYDRDANTMTIKIPDGTPCYISYQAKVLLEVGETFSSDPASDHYAGNEVELSGELEDTVSSEYTMTGSVVSTKGEIKSENATVTLFKFETDAYHIPVEGAYYSAKILYYWDTTSNSPKIADDAYMAQIRANNALAKYDPAKFYSTGSDGILYFTDIYYDYLYEIREVSAPDGYSVNSEPIYLYFKGNDEADYKNATAEQLGGIDPAKIKLLTDEESLLEVNDDKIPEALPQIKVSKRIYGNSGAGDIALSGAELQILDQGSEVITWTSSGAPRTFYVNNGIGAAPEGEIVLEPDKEYTLHEVRAPYGYSTAEDIKFKISLSSDKKDATIQITQGVNEVIDVSATVNNETKNIKTIVMRDKHCIFLNKINDDNKNLAGATLEVYTTTNGTTLGTKVLDLGTTPDKVDVTPSGDADTLKVGDTYILHEDTAPAGYATAKDIAFKVNDDYQIVLEGTYTNQDVLVSSDRLMLSMKDHKLTNIEIIKVDAANTATKLSGAKFDLYDKTGTNLIQAGLNTGTDTNGKLTFSNIPFGEYIIRETAAPTDYEIIVQDTPVTIGSEGMKLADGTIKAPDASNTVHITLTNSKKEIPMARLEITKVDSVNSSIKLSGAEFTLTGIAPAEIVGTKFTGTTGLDGKAVITNIPYGTYQLTETKAPTGYKDTPSSIEGGDMNSSNLIDTSSTSWKITFNNNATKVDNIAVVSATVKDEKLTGKLKVTKKDSKTGAVLSGAEFTLKDSNGKYYQADGTASTSEVKKQTDGNGTITFTGLPYGEYILTEVTPPNYYQIDESTKIQSVTINSTTEKSVTVTDTRYTFFVGKTAIDGTEQLAGAELAIYTADDDTKNKYTSVSDVDLAGNKKIVSWTTTTALMELELGDYLSSNNNRLLPGNYALREITAPAGYCIAPAIKFSVSNDGKLTLVESNDHAQLSSDQLTLTMKDDHTGAIRIVKLDANISNGPIYLDEVRFKVYRLENGVETEIGTLNLGRDSDVAAGTKLGDEYVTDSDGEIVINNLPDGIYVFEETVPKTGYLITTPKTTVVLERSKITSLSGNGYSDLKGVSATIYNTNSTDVKGAIRISKKDKGNDAKLAGATFELYRGNELIISGSSDQEGNIVFKNIPYGDYRLVETKIPKDYKVTAENITAIGNGTLTPVIGVVDSNIEIRFKLDATTVKQNDPTYTFAPAISGTPASGGVIDFNVYNERKSRDFVVKKTDSANGNLLQNAEFTLYTDAAATTVYSVLGNVVRATTDSNGLATFSNLEYGTYYMKETRTPAYYAANGMIYKVVVDDTTEGMYIDAASAFEVTNDPIMLHFDKKELGTTTSLTGARLKLTLENGNITREFSLTENNPIWDFKLASEETASTVPATLCPGNYTLEETGVPEGYRKAPQVKFTIGDTGEITVTEGNSNTNVNGRTLTLYDEPAGKILVTKVDADNLANYLKGVEFKLYKDNGSHTIGTQPSIATKVTNDNGQVIFDDLALGSYILKEVTPPEGYLFSAADGLYYLDVVRDDVSTNDVKENETKITVTNKKEVKLGNILLTKKDSETSVSLKDAEFQLITTQGGNEVVLATAKTDDNGKLVFRNIALGSYIVRETKAPDGYGMERMDYDVTITESNCTNHTVPALGGGTEEIKCYPLEVKNTKLKGSVVIKKSDSRLENKYLSGAKFELYYKDDVAPNHLGSRVDLNIYTTDTGSNLGIIRIENLLFGDYVLKEITAPDGYEINSSQEYTEFTIDSKTTPTQVEVENDIKYGSLTITKYDKESYDHQGTSGTTLRGAVYALFSDAECLENQKLATGITDENGVFKFDQLAYGTYYLKEMVAPENYKVDPDVKTITIPNAASVPVLSQPVTDETAKGKLKIIKLDSANDAPLKDAKFKLVNSNGDIINSNGTVVPTGQQGEFSTNAEGILEYSNLPYGVYTLEETQTPSYYIKDQDAYSVLINKEAETELKVYNHNISIEISKRAINDNAELKGATLAIKDQSGNIVVPAWASDSNKVISLGAGAGQIKPGTKYVLTELERPAGYLFAKDVVFTVNDAGEITIDSVIDPAEAVAKEYGNTAPLLSEDKHTVIMYDDFNQNFFTEFYISKRELTGSDELAGATLEILKDGTVLKTIQTTTASQKITVGVGKDLEHEQEYVLHEANAPKGYAIAEDIRFVVHRDGKAEILSTEGEFLEDDHLLIMRDRKKSATEQSIAVRKLVTGTTDYVKGAELAICDKDGNVIVTWISDEADKNFDVDFSGVTLAFNVDYIFTETKAPEGFEKAKDILFRINEDGTISVLGPNGHLDAERRILTMFDQQITTGSEEDSDEDDGSGESSKDPRLVDTGDHTPILRYIIMMILSLLVMIGYAVEERKDKDLS